LARMRTAGESLQVIGGGEKSENQLYG
jgi:hypothetical protein